MITLRICQHTLPRWAQSTEGFETWCIIKCAEAGIPTTGGPITAKLDLSKGTLTTMLDPETDDIRVVWEPK